MILEYCKKNEKVKTPTRSNPSDAGLDVYAHLSESIVIAPAGNSLIPTGLRFGVPHGYMLQVCNRSSMGANRSLVVGAHIVDSGYAGEIFIDLHNIGQDTQYVAVGEKIAQLVLVPVVHFRAREITEPSAKLYDSPITISDRGADSLGSTDEHPLNGMPVGGF